MKKIGILLLLCIGFIANAQNTTVTATVTDSDGTVWANGTWTVDFLPGLQAPLPSQYSVNGAALSSTVIHQTGTLSSAGALSVVLYDSSLTTPTGSGWTLRICPRAQTACSVYNFSTAGSSMSISSNLTSVITAPRVNCSTGCYAYNTTEITTPTVLGASFFNTSTNSSYKWNGTSWQAATSVLCKISTPVNNTGNTTSNTVSSCTIPAGSLGTSGQLAIQAEIAACTANGAPFTACTAANTGTCTPRIAFGSLNTSASVAFTAAHAGEYRTIVANNNATNVQVFHTVEYSTTAPGVIAGTSAIDTTAAVTLNFQMQNSVAADQCFYNVYTVTTVP